MNRREQVYWSVFIVFIFFSCSTYPPENYSTNQSIDEPVDIVEIQSGEKNQLAEKFAEIMEELRNECAYLRSQESNLKNLRESVDFEERLLVNDLNKNQLILYSEWYESLNSSNHAKQKLLTIELLNSLDKEKKIRLFNLYSKSKKYQSAFSEFEERRKNFEDRKTDLLNFMNLAIDDGQLFRTLKYVIDKDLAY